MPDRKKFKGPSQDLPMGNIPPFAATTDAKQANGPDRAAPAKPTSSKRKAKAKADAAPETTFERAESLPDETQAAPELPPLQEAEDLDDLLSSAIAPDDEDVALAEMEMGPPDYPALTRRTSPPRWSQSASSRRASGSMTVYLLTVKEGGAGRRRSRHVSAQSKLCARSWPDIRSFKRPFAASRFGLGVTSLGVPFFLEVNLDDHGIWGQSRRDLVAIAETKWVTVTSDRQAGYLPLGLPTTSKTRLS